MTRKIKLVAKVDNEKTEITITHTKWNAWTPTLKKEVAELRNAAIDLLRARGFNYSDIKEVK